MLGALLDDQRHASADALNSPDRGAVLVEGRAADSVRTNRASRATARAASWHKRRVASASGSRISLYRVRQSVTPSLPTQTRRALGLSQKLGAAAAHGSYRTDAGKGLPVEQRPGPGCRKAIGYRCQRLRAYGPTTISPSPIASQPEGSGIAGPGPPSSWFPLSSLPWLLSPSWVHLLPSLPSWRA